ncbi:hypothetical protein NBO_3g0031 [Nosema bombycis CQ1]|uniref:Uncharacterized protein n=1 Tax=Nosema bombycis (strain CQ1 / CVCC 102059) TaxID=578461 RepID=R0MMN8_NOSB1|nr:hypothetical protein NBO_3g0031 [Nosema bombycis CQ1]|eukprot:EOB15480.1 hypothetical protein NBO_3g0031 [Nosema bombycis CQ1]
MKLELIIILLRTLTASVCQSDQLGSLPLATQFQPATRIVGSVNNVQTYTQNRKDCVKPVVKKQNVQPVAVPVVKKQVVKSSPKLSQPNYSSSLKFIRPSQVVQKSTSTVPPPSYNPPIRLVPIVVKPRPETPQQNVKPPIQYVTPPPIQYVTPPPQYVTPSTQYVTPSTQPQYVAPPQPEYVTPSVPQYIPPPIQYVSTPTVQYVPTPQFIPLNLLCNMNILPPLPECAPHKIAVPIVNLQEMPKMAVPQSIVPKIVQNKGIQDVELIKVINGISLIELRRLNRVVGGIYAIVNHLSTEVEKQKSETKQMKNQMMRQAYGSVLCADNPYTQTVTQNQGKLCFKVIADDKVSKFNGAGNMNGGYSLVTPTQPPSQPTALSQPTQPYTQPTAPSQPTQPSFPACSSKNLKGPCIFIENSNLQIRPTENENVSISCTKKDNGGVCIDSNGINPTPLEEKIVVTTSTTVGDRNGRDNDHHNLNNNHQDGDQHNNNQGNQDVNHNENALPVQHAIGKHGYLEDETIQPTYHFDDEIVNDMDRSIKLEGNGHFHGNGNRNGHAPENLSRKENGGSSGNGNGSSDQGNSHGNGHPNEGNGQNIKNGRFNESNGNNNHHRPHHHDHYPQDHYPRDNSFKNHSEFWNSTLGNKDDPPYSYDLLDDPQYYSPSHRQSPLINVLLDSSHAYHRNHWKNVLRELTRREPFYGNYPTDQNEDYRNLMRRIASSDICSGVSDKTSCLKIYNYLLMSSKQYLSPSLINNLLNQNLSKEEFADNLNKMITQVILQQRNKSFEDEEEPYDDSRVGRTDLYGSCSLGEAEVSPGRCMTVMRMSDLIRGDKYNDCDYSNGSMTCPETSPRMSTFFLSDLLS